MPAYNPTGNDSEALLAVTSFSFWEANMKVLLKADVAQLLLLGEICACASYRYAQGEAADALDIEIFPSPALPE